MKRTLFLLLGLLGLPAAASQAAQPPLRVACIGNSITYGPGIADREHDPYPAVPQQPTGDG